MIEGHLIKFDFESGRFLLKMHVVASDPSILMQTCPNWSQIVSYDKIWHFGADTWLLQPRNFDMRAVALTTHLLYWSTIGLRKLYILIDSDILDALTKFVWRLRSFWPVLVRIRAFRLWFTWCCVLVYQIHLVCLIWFVWLIWRSTSTKGIFGNRLLFE